MSPVPNVLPRFSSRFTNGITKRAPALPVQFAQLKLLPDSVTVATGAADHATGHGGPAGPVWQVLGRAGRVTLTDLPEATVGGTRWDE